MGSAFRRVQGLQMGFYTSSVLGLILFLLILKITLIVALVNEKYVSVLKTLRQTLRLPL